MEKLDALKILFQCADQYHEKLCDNTLLIISANTSGNKTFATEILFERTNFLHLTGETNKEEERHEKTNHQPAPDAGHAALPRAHPGRDGERGG